jgi:hypothetical protein
MTQETTLNPAIHAAFRRDLGRFVEALAAFGDSENARVARLGTAWDQLSYQLHRHHQDEESFFWPALDDLGVDGRIIESLQSEHDEMVRCLGAADQAMTRYSAEPARGTAVAAGRAVRELNRVLCDHLAHEESDLEPFSAATMQTKQHRAAKRAARRAHTEGSGTFFAWLTDGCDPEAAHIIGNEVPAPVLWLMTRIGGRDYRRRIAPTWA